MAFLKKLHISSRNFPRIPRLFFLILAALGKNSTQVPRQNSPYIPLDLRSEEKKSLKLKKLFIVTVLLCGIKGSIPQQSRSRIS
jgi:hypothetical protein